MTRRQPHSPHWMALAGALLVALGWFAGWFVAHRAPHACVCIAAPLIN